MAKSNNKPNKRGKKISRKQGVAIGRTTLIEKNPKPISTEIQLMELKKDFAMVVSMISHSIYELHVRKIVDFESYKHQTRILNEIVGKHSPSFDIAV